MLNLNDPQSEFIFKASRLQERIRPIILEAGRNNRNLNGKEQQEISIILLELRKLNEDHFGASEEIQETLDRLENTIMANDSIEWIWEAFMDLSERSGGNFGTCWI